MVKRTYYNIRGMALVWQTKKEGDERVLLQGNDPQKVIDATRELAKKNQPSGFRVYQGNLIVREETFGEEVSLPGGIKSQGPKQG